MNLLPLLRPELFNVCKNEMLGKTTKELMETEFLDALYLPPALGMG